MEKNNINSDQYFILELLSNKELSGHEIVLELESQRDFILSGGQCAIYPVLHFLKKKNLLVSRRKRMGEDKKRVVYTITKKGRKQLKITPIQVNMENTTPESDPAPSHRDWSTNASDHVIFFVDRNRVLAELTDHMDDIHKQEKAEGTFSLLSNQAAIGKMGSSEKIGEALKLEHNPWFGRVWLLSRILFVACLLWLALPLYNSGMDMIGGLFYATEPNVYSEEEEKGFYLSEEPTAPHPEANFTKIEMENISQQWENEDYIFVVEAGALWLCEYPSEDGSLLSEYVLRLTTQDKRKKFWMEDMKPSFLCIEDSVGTTYGNEHSNFGDKFWYREGFPPSYSVCIEVTLDSDVQWVDLYFPNMDQGDYMRINIGKGE